MTYYLESDRHYRISKSGYSIKTGWADDTRIVASYPGGAEHPLNAERFNQWLDDAEHICQLHNAALSTTTASGGEHG